MAKEKLTWGKASGYYFGYTAKKILILLDRDIDLSWSVYDQRAAANPRRPGLLVARDLDSMDEAKRVAEQWLEKPEEQKTQ